MSELLATIARVRRAMPRNADVMVICDAAERAAVRVDAPVAAVMKAPAAKKRTKKKAKRPRLMTD